MNFCLDCAYGCYRHEKYYCLNKNGKEISIFDTPCSEFVSIADMKKQFFTQEFTQQFECEWVGDKG